MRWDEAGVSERSGREKPGTYEGASGPSEAGPASAGIVPAPCTAEGPPQFISQRLLIAKSSTNYFLRTAKMLVSACWWWQLTDELQL